jgi:DNA polymerase I-like protein with 3'-5' exonuclease and polymerase domains
MKIAVIDKQPSSLYYNKYFKFEYDLYHLSSVAKTKILKKDVDIEFNPDNYNYIVLVGAEAAKYYIGKTIGDLAGYVIDDKYIPIISPAALLFRPEIKDAYNSALDRLHRNIVKETTVNNNSANFTGIDDELEAVKYLETLYNNEDELIALDTETSALYPREGSVLGISISYAKNSGVYINADVFSDTCVDLLQKIINKSTVVFHNAKFDIAMLKYHFNLKFNENKTHDTLLMHYMLDETVGSHGLKDLALRFTEYGLYDKDLEEFKLSYMKKYGILKEDFNYSYIPFNIIAPYAAMDAAITLELYEKFSKILFNADKVKEAYFKIVLPTLFLIIDMEETGIPFNKQRLEWAKNYIEDKLHEANRELYTLPEIIKFQQFRKDTGVKDPIFNPNSPTQLRIFLFDYLGIPSPGKLTGTGELSTDAEVLESIKHLHPIVNNILTIRKYGKILNTYISKILNSLDKDCKVRTGFNQSSTTSGRLSSSGKFNAQQIVRDDPIVKGCIVAPNGYKIVSQDLSTAEMYYAAVLSGDTSLQKVFINGEDFHSTIAKQVFKLPCTIKEVKKLFPDERQAAKAISFGILYGSGPNKVSETVSKSSEKEFSLEDAVETIEKYFRAFPHLRKWLDDSKQFIKQYGYIYSFFGRKRRLKNVFSIDKGTAGHSVRSGINFLVQSVASDINLIAAVEINKQIKEQNLDANIIMLVHDSIVAIVKDVDVDNYCEIAKRITQLDKGISITNCPIGVDQDISSDYSFGHFEEVYGKLFKEYQVSCLSAS